MRKVEWRRAPFMGYDLTLGDDRIYGITEEELKSIVLQGAKMLDIKIDDGSDEEG